MPVNTAFQGKSYPPSGPYAVDAMTVAAFAEAVGATDPVHSDPDAAREAGYAGVVAPPTLAVRYAQQCDAQLIGDPEAGIDFSRVVHGEQSFVHHRPITAGDELIGTLHVDTVRMAGANAMVTTRTELTDLQGEAVCTSVSTIVVRGGE